MTGSRAATPPPALGVRLARLLYAAIPITLVAVLILGSTI
jgi:hypothetical protein